MGLGRRKSITEQHKAGGEPDAADALRESLSSLKGLMKDVIGAVEKDDQETVRLRSKSAAKVAAREASLRAEGKERTASIAAEAASAGILRTVEAEAVVQKRRLSLVATEAAAQIDDPDNHDDGCETQKLSPSVVPEWQVDTRRRGSSLAIEAAGLIANKQTVKRRGSAVATEAGKHALMKGLVTDHD